jgi:hypothetical protein
VTVLAAGVVGLVLALLLADDVTELEFVQFELREAGDRRVAVVCIPLFVQPGVERCRALGMAQFPWPCDSRAASSSRTSAWDWFDGA